ncbi:MAG: hypothetical protein R3F38_01220 [Gammaproteobacteria bacterium]
MGFFQQLQQQTEAARQRVMTAPVLTAVPEGRFDVQGYRYFLEQAYHHVKHTVPFDDGLAVRACPSVWNLCVRRWWNISKKSMATTNGF